MKKEKICGVYMWVNKINNKKYIGVSIDIYKRWDSHNNQARYGNERYFYRAIRKYGYDNFDKIILERYDIYDKKTLKDKEDYYINYYDSLNSGYNMEFGYNSITNHPNIENIKKKISDKAKDRKWINNGKKNITCNSADIDNYINNGWCYGRLKFSDEHIKNLSDSHIGIKLSEEAKIKTGNASRNRIHSEETKNKMSTDRIGRYTMKWYIDKYGEEQGMIKYSNHHNHYKNKDKNIICINNGIINKMINEKDLEEYINNNWVKGKLKKIKI